MYLSDPQFYLGVAAVPSMCCALPTAPALLERCYFPGWEAGETVAGDDFSTIRWAGALSPPQAQPGRAARLLLRRIFTPGGLDAFQNRQAQEYDCTYCDPMPRDMQDHGSIDEPADQYQESDQVNPE